MMRPRTPLLAVVLWMLAALVPLGLAATGAPFTPREASPQVQDGQSAQVAMLNDSARAAGEQEPGRATALTAVAVDERDGDVTVRLTGNGKLTASSVQVPDGAPPRLALDFTGVTSRTSSVVSGGKGLVQRVRVARFSATPLVTRVVVDLTGTFLYKVRPGDDLDSVVVTIGNPALRARRDDEALSKDFDRPAVSGRASAQAPATAASTTQAAPRATPLPTRTPPDAAEPARPGPRRNDLPTRIPPKPAEPVTPGTTVDGPGAVAAVVPLSAPVARLSADDVARAACDTAVETYPISMDFDGVDLKAILRTFSEVAGVNLVIDPDVDGNVNIKLKDVPWNQALAVVLRTNGLACVPVGSIVRIAPRGTLTTELSEGTKLRLAQADEQRNRLRQTRVIQLSYASAKEIGPTVAKTVMTPSFGSFEVDEKTNLIILSDLPEALQAAEALIARLDEAPMQVEIEARIIRTTKEFARELGIRWGFGGAAAPELGNTTGLAFPNSVRADGLAGSINQQADFARLSLGALNGALTLDAALSALENNRQVNILLRPRVVTQNNVKAQITRGQEIPYTTLAAPPAGEGVQILQQVPTVQFKTAALTLAVTPRITASDTVILDVDVDNGSPGAAEANGNRSINTQRVQTVVLVRNEGTTVIGGIYEEAESFNEERTPGLSRIPLLGRLFRRNTADDSKGELLIFITPRILRDGGPVK